MPPQTKQPQSPKKGSPTKQEVKGLKVENQPFDLAVEVNDSEEIDSEEDEDEVHVGTTTQTQPGKPGNPQERPLKSSAPGGG